MPVEHLMTHTIFMGTSEFAVPSLATLLQEGYQIVAVYTQPDRPAGRGRKLEASPVKEFALAHGLPIRQPTTLRDPAAQAELAALAPTIIVVAAYGLILPQAVLALPPCGCVNVHGSLLPRHRGAAPIAAAILAGDRETGVSIMLMDEGVDTGPVLATASLPIRDDDTTGSLTARLAELGARLLAQTLPRWLRGEIMPQPQSAAGATYAPRIEKSEGQINWAEPAYLIARRVRAYHPWPSAYTTWKGQLLKILRARAEDLTVAGPCGQVLAGEGEKAGVVTGAGVLWLEEVQLAGKRALPIAAFLRGAPGFIGSRLG
jgi:methionyl-tRNA formyltransferase